MRRYSPKRRQRNDAARSVREGLIAAHAKCMICGRSPKRPHRDKPHECSQLCVHEIANGPNRCKALDKPYACLVLCWWCNGAVVTDKGVWPESRQLALLRRCTPGNFDLAAYNQLINPRAPNRITLAEVDAFTS